MDDEVLELTRKCAEAISYKIDAIVGTCCYHYNANGSAYKYEPRNDSTQAFELLYWLAQHATVSIDMHPNIDGFFTCLQIDPGVYFREQPISTPAELRLALMRATVKVHEGRGK